PHVLVPPGVLQALAGRRWCRRSASAWSTPGGTRTCGFRSSATLPGGRSSARGRDEREGGSAHQRAPLPVPVAQQALVDLAGDGTRQRVGDFEALYLPHEPL